MARSIHGRGHGVCHRWPARPCFPRCPRRLLSRAHRAVDRLRSRGLSGACSSNFICGDTEMRIAWLLLAALPLAAQDGRGPIQLSLKRAVELATSREGNTNIQLAGEALKQAESRSLEARAALLPDFESSVSYQNRTENLQALGLRI